MKTVSITDEFDCSADTYWEKFMFDDSFFEKLNPQIQIKKREILEKKDDATTLYRKIKNTPSIEMPGVVAKVIGSDASYIEESWFTKATKAYRFTVSSQAAGKRLDFQGTIAVVSLGDKKCRREMRANIKVDVMFVGGTIEEHLAKQITDGYKAATRVTREEITRLPA
jgi:LPS O-antigen subunit length determinant protein (WzzB/FepE family)